MEPSLLIGVYPLRWGAGWAVTRKCGGGCSYLVGLAFDRRSATLELSELRLGVTRGASD